ncbi:MAG: heme o synthase, partial [Candidatus Binatia bacterium]
ICGMTTRSATTPLEVPASRRARIYLELTKPRVVLMVLITTLVGFYLGALGPPDVRLLAHTLLSTALAAGGTLALNQYLERDLDAKMIRTRTRPLPDGRIRPDDALLFGVALAASGLVYQTLAVSALAASTTALTTASYLFLYTPMKRHTSLCSLVGAVPGALPPVTGWVAARGGLGIEAWVLFSILFLWQLPHSLAIARIYRDDYARAGIRLLPVIDPDSATTERQIVLNSLALFTVALLPTLVGVAGGLYFVVALGLGIALLVASVRLSRSRSLADARRLLYATLVYLPVLLGVMAFDKVTF